MTSSRARLTVGVARAWRRRWDRQQERLIPGREERFDAILDAIGRAVGPRFRALDLGCGTGSLTERLLDRYPEARVVALDFDPITLRLGRTALGDRAGRVTWVEADLRDPRWSVSVPAGRFDAAVSTTALHWLTEPELRRVYHRLGDLLRPRGVFLNGDSFGFAPDSKRLARLARAASDAPDPAPGGGESWAAWWRAVLREPRLADEAAMHRARFPGHHERTPTPDLRGHERLLRDSGFREVEVIWGRWRYRVLAAVR